MAGVLKMAINILVQPFIMMSGDRPIYERGIIEKTACIHKTHERMRCRQEKTVIPVEEAVKASAVYVAIDPYILRHRQKKGL